MFGFVVLLVLLSLGCAAFQRRLLYYPDHQPAEAMNDVALSHGLERWTNSTGQPIGWKRIHSTSAAAAEILITHGNGGQALDRVNFANAFSNVANVDVFILEYPGFGDRIGSPTEKSLCEAADDAFSALPKKSPVYLLGESLGTGVACYLAERHATDVAGILLVAPYNRLVDVAQHHMRILPATWFLRDRFESSEHLNHYSGPVFILVGVRDHVVPAEFGRRLFKDYKGPKRILEQPNDDHNSLHNQPPGFWREVMEFWASHRGGLEAGGG